MPEAEIPVGQVLGTPACLPAGGGVPDPHRAVGGQAGAVGLVGHRVHRPGVAGQGVQLLAGGDVPDRFSPPAPMGTDLAKPSTVPSDPVPVRHMSVPDGMRTPSPAGKHGQRSYGPADLQIHS